MILLDVYLLVGMMLFVATQILRAIDRMHTKEKLDFVEVLGQFVWLGLLYPFGLWILFRKLAREINGAK